MKPKNSNMITVCEKIVTLKTVQKFMVLLIAKKILLSVRDIYLFKLTTTNQYSSKINDFPSLIAFSIFCFYSARINQFNEVIFLIFMRPRVIINKMND